MKIAAAAEKRAVGQFASDNQRELENARAEVEALNVKHNLFKTQRLMSKTWNLKLILKKQKPERERKEHPILKSYEDMAVYATQKLAGNLTNKKLTLIVCTLTLLLVQMHTIQLLQVKVIAV